MKTILIIIICLIRITASATVYDTLGFKVKVPKISKVDDRAVGIKITFDTTKDKSELFIVIDGVPVTEEFSATNKNQIESISLLQKTPAQLIGCRPFPSVLVVTTKKASFKKIIIRNEEGEPVPGASMILNNEKVDTISLVADNDGKIITNKLSKNRTYTASISSIGCETKNAKISFANSNEEFIVLKKYYSTYEPIIVNATNVRRICRKIYCTCSSTVKVSAEEIRITGNKENYFKIYPNPVMRSSEITIELPINGNENTIFQFFSLSGQLIFQQQLNPESNIYKIQLPNLAAGIYEVVTFDKQLQKKLTGRLVVL